MMVCMKTLATFMAEIQRSGLIMVGIDVSSWMMLIDMMLICVVYDGF